MKYVAQPVLNRSIALICMVLITVSCGKSGSENNDSITFNEADKRKVIEDLTRTIADLPAPSLVPNTIQQIGASFDHGLISELHGMDDYVLDEDKAALNLGVFSTDIGYLLAYDQVQESIEHMEACRKLSEALGVTTAFDEETMKKYEEAVGDHEELMALLNETIVDAEERLSSSDRLSMAALVLTGSFVEGLYLSMSVIKEYHTDDMDEDTRDRYLRPLFDLVMDQEEPLLDIIGLLEDIPSDPEIAAVLAELKILELLYTGDLKLIEDGMAQDENFVIHQSMLHDISNEVLRIRESIVSF